MSEFTKKIIIPLDGGKKQKVTEYRANGMIKTYEEFIPKKHINLSGDKKANIVYGILTEEDQLNLLATLVDQLATHTALDTPELAYARSKFAEIQTELARTS